jgi:hypothetical protein
MGRRGLRYIDQKSKLSPISRITQLKEPPYEKTNHHHRYRVSPFLDGLPGHANLQLRSGLSGGRPNRASGDSSEAPAV